MSRGLCIGPTVCLFTTITAAGMLNGVGVHRQLVDLSKENSILELGC